METIYSDWVMLSATTNPQPLEDEPRDFRTDGKTHNTITLSWTASERGDEDGYELQREIEAAWASIADVAALTYTDTGLTAQTAYNYRIRSKKNN